MSEEQGQRLIYERFVDSEIINVVLIEDDQDRTDDVLPTGFEDLLYEQFRVK